MKILVSVKRVVGYSVKVWGTADCFRVDLSKVKMSVNPFFEIVVEESIRLKEADMKDSKVVVTINKDQFFWDA